MTERQQIAYLMRVTAESAAGDENVSPPHPNAAAAAPLKPKPQRGPSTTKDAAAPPPEPVKPAHAAAGEGTLAPPRCWFERAEVPPRGATLAVHTWAADARPAGEGEGEGGGGSQPRWFRAEVVKVRGAARCFHRPPSVNTTLPTARPPSLSFSTSLSPLPPSFSTHISLPPSLSPG